MLSAHTFPAQQSASARQAAPDAMHIEPQRRTPEPSSTQRAPLQHCSVNSHVSPIGMQAAESLQRLTPRPVGVQPKWRRTQQLSEPPPPQISPACTQPGGLTQRRTPTASGSPQMLEQQSPFARQISPKGRQPGRCWQIVTPKPPSAQSAEQQSRTPVHGSPELEQEPSVVQRPVVESQPPVQQSAPDVQISPSARHVSWVAQRLVPPAVGTQNPLQQLPREEQTSPITSQPGPALRQTPPVQSFEQHCASPVHDVPTVRHVPVSLHTPPTHEVEQQSAAVVQLAPATAQPLTTWQRRVPSTVRAQSPEQQSLASAQVAYVRAQLPAGSVQMPAAQEPLQHWVPVEQAAPFEERPPSTSPSQSLSTPSHGSLTPGWIAASRSLQSVPSPRQPRSP